MICLKRGNFEGEGVEAGSGRTLVRGSKRPGDAMVGERNRKREIVAEGLKGNEDGE